jgi:phosphatidylglycerophosphatase A
MKIHSRIALIIGTGLGTGYSPVAPGTVGTIASVAVWLIVATFFPSIGFALEAIVLIIVTVISIVITNICLTEGPLANKKDPQQIVIDEWAGLFISFAFLNPSQTYEILTAFLAFRIFDAWKPLFIDSAQHLPRGYGIVADDVLAGLVARAVVFGLWSC